MLTQSAPEGCEPAEDLGQTQGQDALPAHLLRKLRSLEPPVSTSGRATLPGKRPRQGGTKKQAHGAGKALMAGAVITASVLGAAGALWYFLR